MKHALELFAEALRGPVCQCFEASDAGSGAES